MKAMKKIGTGILLTAMTLSMCACSTGKDTTKDSKKSDKSSKKIVTEVDDEDEKEEKDSKKNSKDKNSKDDKKNTSSILNNIKNSDKNSDKGSDSKSDKNTSNKDSGTETDDIDEIIDEEIDEIIDEEIDEIIDEEIDEIIDEEIDEIIDEEIDKGIDEIIDVEIAIDEEEWDKLYNTVSIDVAKDTIGVDESIVFDIITEASSDIDSLGVLTILDGEFNEVFTEIVELKAGEKLSYDISAADIGLDKLDTGWYSVEVENADGLLISFAMFYVEDNTISEVNTDYVINSSNFVKPDDEARGYVEDGVYYNEYFGLSIDVTGGPDIDSVIIIEDDDFDYEDQVIYDAIGLKGDTPVMVIMITKLDVPGYDGNIQFPIANNDGDKTVWYDGISFIADYSDTSFATIKDNTILVCEFSSNGSSVMETIEKI